MGKMLSFKNTMVNGVHRLFSDNGDKRQKVRGIQMYRGEFGGVVLSPIADTNSPCTIDLPKEEMIEICRALLEVADSNAVVVENPTLVTVENENEEFMAFSNVPGMKCKHYRFDPMSDENEDFTASYEEDVDPLKEMDVEVVDQLGYEDDCED